MSDGGRVGLIGLGLVGTALAERLLAAGFAVQGFDIEGEARARFAGLGGTVANSAGEVAAGCDRIVLSLPHSGTVRRVIEETAPDLRSGAIVIDTSTGDPGEIVAIGESLGARGVRYIDATIGGSSKLVREGRVIVLCGGDPEVFAACRDLFGVFSAETFHLGPVGAGARMKLVLNLVLGLNRAVLAEGLAYAGACGIDEARALEVLKAGPAYSRAMDAKGERMLRGNFAPEARLSQHLKDVRLILATGEQAGASLPLSRIHRDLLEWAEAAGLGDADNSAIVKAFRPGAFEGKGLKKEPS